MTRSNNALTKFDPAEVTPAQMALVRAQLPAWLPKARAKFGEKPSMSVDILHDFLNLKNHIPNIDLELCQHHRRYDCVRNNYHRYIL